MIRSRWALFSCVALLAASGWSAWRAADKKAAPFEVKDVAVRVSGPYAHENLTIFFLHGTDQDKRAFLTLDQGIDKKVVKVTEKAQEQVGELTIENASDQFLFLQEGDRLQGGKQDRIIITSLIVPPRSGKMAVPTFCIEQGRWAAGLQGAAFGNASNTVLAGKDVRTAAKVTPARGGQAAVWREVAYQKMVAERALGAKNTNTSLNETLDSPEVKKLCDACGKALGGLPGKHKDAVGVAVAVNGRLEEVNVYPNHDLFARIYPRLLESYALQAALTKKDKGAKGPAVAADDVKKFMTAGKEKERRFEDIDKDNRLRVRDLEGKVFECVTAYKGQPMHRQWLNRIAPAPEGKNEARPQRDNRDPQPRDRPRP